MFHICFALKLFVFLNICSCFKSPLVIDITVLFIYFVLLSCFNCWAQGPLPLFRPIFLQAQNSNAQGPIPVFLEAHFVSNFRPKQAHDNAPAHCQASSNLAWPNEARSLLLPCMSMRTTMHSYQPSNVSRCHTPCMAFLMQVSPTHKPALGFSFPCSPRAPTSFSSRWNSLLTAMDNLLSPFAQHAIVTSGYTNFLHFNGASSTSTACFFVCSMPIVSPGRLIGFTSTFSNQ